MGLLWASIGLPCVSCESPIDLSWAPMGLPWASIGSPWASMGLSHESPMGRPWETHGRPMDLETVCEKLRRITYIVGIRAASKGGANDSPPTVVLLHEHAGVGNWGIRRP